MGFRYKGSLKQFNNSNYAYRCEHQYQRYTFIIWKEFGNWWRLERWEQDADYIYARYSLWTDLIRVLPRNIFVSDNWQIFTYTAP